MTKRTEVGLVYLAGLVQGVALVTFPAASSIFTNPYPKDYGFSSAFFPLSISFGGKEFPRLTEVVSGVVIAFYQIGYGLLRLEPEYYSTHQVCHDRPFTGGSLLAGIMIVLAFLVIRPQTRSDTHVNALRRG